MSQSSSFHDTTVIGIAKFTLGTTLINSAHLLGTPGGDYALVVFNSQNEHEVIDTEKFLELADNVRRLLLEYNPDRLLQIASEDAAEAAVQSLDEVYSEVDKEAEKYRALLEALVNQSQDENDLSE